MLNDRASLPQQTLIVPVPLHALVVNTAERDPSPSALQMSWMRFKAQFDTLLNVDSPEPVPFSHCETPDTGVYLQWELPRGLRHGCIDLTDKTTSTWYPHLPDRWLITRYFQHPPDTGNSTSWVIESNCTDQGTSSFPQAQAIGGTYIGRKIALKNWHEHQSSGPGTYYPLPLTAVSSGIEDFLMFQPYTENIYSCYDDLKGVPDQATLHYSVIGWYAFPDHDPLFTSQEDIAHTCQNFFLQPPPNLESIPNNTQFHWVCQGMSHCIGWALGGDRPPSAQDTIRLSALQLAVGETQHSAYTAWHHHTISSEQDSLAASEDTLLRYLWSNSNSDQHLSAADINHRHAFDATPGERYYVCLPKTASSKVVQLSSNLLDDLCELNSHSILHHRTQACLQQTYQIIYELWIKDLKQIGNLMAPTSIGTKLKRELTTTSNQIQTYQTTLSNLHTTIQTLKQRIHENIKSHASQYRLKQLSSDPYWTPKDPGIVVTGIQSPWINHTPPDQLPTQFLHDVLQTITVNHHTFSCPSSENLPDLSALPFHADPLVQQFLMLAQLNHQLLKDAKAQNPGLPYYGCLPWEQPWLPHFLEWQISYHTPSSGNVIKLKGRDMLRPSLNFMLNSNIRASLQASNNSALANHVQQATQPLDLLSCNLSGFYGQLARQKLGTYSHPKTVKNHTLPRQMYRCPHLTSLSNDNPYMRFNPLIALKWKIDRLSVVDRFGRSCNVMGDGLNNYPVVSPELKSPPDYQDFNLQTTPRVIQPTRLTAQWVNASHYLQPIQSRDLSSINPLTNPIIGWILFNQGDNSFMVYNQHGEPHCELRSVQIKSNTTRATYKLVISPVPIGRTNTSSHGYTSDPQDSGLLEAWITSLQQQLSRAQTLKDLLAQAFYNKSPIDQRFHQMLSVVAGRPMALVRVALRWELLGSPLQNPNWPYNGWNIVNQNWYTELTMSVNFADPHNQHDGFLGYYHSDSFDTIYTRFSTKNIDNSSGYIQPITTTQGASTTLSLPLRPTRDQHQHDYQLITCFMDPTKEITLYSHGILPPLTIRLPQQCVDGPLKSMQVTFRIGPLLIPHYPNRINERLNHQCTPVVNATIQPPPPSLDIPHLASHQQSTWYSPYKEQDRTKFLFFSLKQPHTHNQTSNQSPGLVDGYLIHQVEDDKKDGEEKQDHMYSHTTMTF